MYIHFILSFFVLNFLVLISSQSSDGNFGGVGKCLTLFCFFLPFNSISTQNIINIFLRSLYCNKNDFITISAFMAFFPNHSKSRKENEAENEIILWIISSKSQLFSTTLDTLENFCPIKEVLINNYNNKRSIINFCLSLYFITFAWQFPLSTFTPKCDPFLSAIMFQTDASKNNVIFLPFDKIIIFIHGKRSRKSPHPTYSLLEKT